MIALILAAAVSSSEFRVPGFKSRVGSSELGTPNSELPGVSIEPSATSRKKGKDWELVLSGKTRGLPEGAVLTMRFFKAETRVRWKDRAILAAAGETPWVRKVYVEGNAFTHAETLPSATEVRVEFLFVPEDQEVPDLRQQMGADYRPHRVIREFRVGRVQDVSLAKDHEALLDRGEEARRILKAMMLTQENREELQKQKKELEKLLQKVRDERTLLGGSAAALAAVLQDLYNSVGAIPKNDQGSQPETGDDHSGGKGPRSTLTGEGLTLEKIVAIVDELRDVAGREAALFLFRAGMLLREEAIEARKAKPDGWVKLRAVWEKDLAALRSSWSALQVEVAGMEEFLAETESFARATIAAVEGSTIEVPPLDADRPVTLEKKLRKN